MNQKTPKPTLEELIELAKSRDLLDVVKEEAEGCRLTIGAGVFHLGPMTPGR